MIKKFATLVLLPRSSGLALIVTGCFCLVAGAGIGLVLRGADDPFERYGQFDSERRLAPVGVVESFATAPARLELSWQQAAPISVGPISGRITALSHNQSDPSTIMLAVDGRHRPILRSKSPLWRNIDGGSTGDDVDAVMGLFTSMHLMDATVGDALADEAFVAAVREFERQAGWSESGVFRPDYVLWISPDQTLLGEIALSVGDLVTGEAVLASPASVVTQAIAVPASADVELPMQLDESYEFQLLASQFSVGFGSNGGVRIADLDELTRRIEPQTTEIAGLVRLVNPQTRQVVPTGAVYVTSNGATCVVLASGTQRPVRVLGGRGGLTEIVPDLPADAQVVVDPAAPKSCSP
jgi:hypothetical protein